MRPAREWLAVDAVLAAGLAVACLLEIWSPHLMPGVGAVEGNRIVLTATSLPDTSLTSRISPEYHRATEASTRGPDTTVPAAKHCEWSAPGGEPLGGDQT